MGELDWRFMGSCKRGHKSPNMRCKYSYPTYNPTWRVGGLSNWLF